MGVLTELEVQKRELGSLLQDLRSQLRKIKDFQPDRKQKLQECQQIAQQIRTVREGFVLELRSCTPEERKPYEAFLKEKMTEFKKLQQELEYKKNEIDREQLNDEVEAGDVDPLSVDAVIKEGDTIQDKSEQAINRMKMMVADAEDIGVATAQKMDEQTEQMLRIEGGLDDVKYNINRSKKTVNDLAKNAAKDRCIQIMCGLIWVLLIVIVILIALKVGK